MAFELDSLVAYIYVAGGRTIDITPPGMLVEVTPEKIARGRETDTLFVAVLPSGSVAPNTFYEQMALMTSELYFANTGSVTSALRSVCTVLNQNLYEHNSDTATPFEANFICGVLRGTELYVIRTGAGVCVLQHNGHLVSLPEDLNNDEDLFRAPLGTQPMPDMKLAHYDVMSGSRLILTDYNIAGVYMDQLTMALTRPDMDLALDDLQGMAPSQSQMMIIEFVPADQSTGVPVLVGESTAKITSEVAKVRAQENQATLPQPEAPNPKEVFQQISKQTLEGVGQIAGRTAQGLRSVGSALDKDTSHENRRSGWRIALSRLITGAVIVIPIVIVFMVVVSWVAGVGDTEFDQCLDESVEARDVARAIDSNNRESTLVAWRGVLEIARVCETLRETDPTIQTVLREAQLAVDSLERIKRREANVLASFPGAKLSTLILQGLDLYALDKEQSQVYHVKIGSDGMSPAAPGQPIPNMRRGATVDGLTIGNIIDIDYDRVDSEIVALDDQGVLIRCLPQFVMQCDAQRVESWETWVDPIDIDMWNGRLYVLDRGLEQIFRYEPSGREYASVPSEYFTGQVRPNMAEVSEFDISEDGDVFVLYGFGDMEKYIQGQPKDFRFVGFMPGLQPDEVTVQSMYMNDSPIKTGFMLISQPARTVYETTLSGTFVDSYRVFDEEQFTFISDVAVEPKDGFIYVTSGNAILAFPKAVDETASVSSP